MRSEDENISRLLKKSLPSAQQEEETGKRVFYKLLLAQTENPAATMPNDDEGDFHWTSRPRFSMAVALTAALVSFLFIVVVAKGFRRAATPSGDPISSGESVQASSPEGKVLDLPDGSQVEMRWQTLLQVEHAADGLRIRLNGGSVIVTAAKQGAGHLYVETKDAMVSVVGTVFIVSSEQTGSRVGVLDGVVDVRYAAVSQKLSPGQQAATNPEMQPVPLDVQVSWSRNAARYLALLQQPVPPAQRPAVAALAAPPQNRPAASSQNTQEPDSVLVIGTASNRAARTSTTTPETERAMEQALTSREAVTDLFFRTEADYFQLNRAEYFVPVTLKLPGMQLAGSPSAKRISLDIFGQVTDAYGTTVQNLRDAIDMQLTDETAKQLPARQIAYSAGFTLLPGKYSFKFVIRDGITDRVGTYQTDIVIPNLWKELGNLPISSVVLSNELANFDNILSNSAPSAVDQLIIGGKKLIPSVTRTFSNSRDLIVYLQAYEPDSKPTEPVTAFVTLSRGQTKILETTPVTISDEVNRKALRILPIQLRVPLRTLPEGPYDFQVTVLDTVTQKSTVWQSTINVVN